MLNNVHWRKISAIIGVFLFSLTLTACGSGDRNPTGNLNTGAVHTRLGDNRVTYGDLWNELRFSSLDVLTEFIDEVILAPHLEHIEYVIDSGIDHDDYERFRELLDEFALDAVFGVTEEVFALLSPTERTNRVQIFLANLAINDWRYIQMIQENPNNRIMVEDILPYPTNRDLESVYFEYIHQFFFNDLAQRLFAMSELEKQIYEHNREYNRGNEDNPFHTDSDILNHFRENFQYTGQVEAIIIPFVDATEANNTLRSFGIKVHNNQWFFIPGNEEDTWHDFVTYFDEVTIDIHNPSDQAIPLAAFPATVILQLFAEMHNFIYGFRAPINSGINLIVTDVDRREVTQRILDETMYTSDVLSAIRGNGNDYIEFYRDDLENLGGVALRNFVYRDLTPLSLRDDQDTPTGSFNFFNPEPRAFGGRTFLAFKMSVDYDIDEDNLIVDGEELIIYDEDGNEILNPEQTYLHKRIISELNEERVDSTFIFNAMVDARNEISVRIFDQILEIAFSLENPDHSRTLGRAPNGNTMAVVRFRGDNHYLPVTTTEDTVGVFDRLELTMGTTTSVDLLTRVVMRGTDEFTRLLNNDETRENFLTSLNITLARFSNNEFAAQGFPASMGSHNFMLMQFRTANVSDIIENFFMVNAAMSHYINNFFDNDALIDAFIDFTNMASENFISFSAISIFISLDDDEDGIADAIYDLNADGLPSIENPIINIDRYNKFDRLSRELDLIITRRIDNSTDDASTVINQLVEEFNNSGRHSHGFDDPSGDHFDPTQPESTWAEFRHMGIRLSIVEFENITNISDSSVIPAPLLNRARDIFENDESFIQFEEHINLPHVDDRQVATYNGLHRLVITQASLAHDFEFTEDDDLFDFFQDIPIVIGGEFRTIDDLKSDGEITRNQILLFIFENLHFNSNNFLPREIMPAMQAFFAPVFSRFTGATTQRELLVHFMENRADSTIEFMDGNAINSVRMDRFAEIRRLGQQLEDSFITGDGYNNNFYGWWNMIETLFGNTATGGNS